MFIKWNLSIYCINFERKPKSFNVFLEFFFGKSGTFLCNPKSFKQSQNVLKCSKIFCSRSRMFSFIKKLLNKTRTFWCVPDFFYCIIFYSNSGMFLFNAKTLKQNYKNFVEQFFCWHSPSLYWHLRSLYWHFLDLSCYTLIASVNILWDLFESCHSLYNILRPYRNSRGLCWHSHCLYKHSFGS